jgi:beta-galactosidase
VKKILYLLMVVGVGCAFGQPRQQVYLNGVWQFSPGDLRQEKLLPGAKWTDFPVPSFWDRAQEFGIQPTWLSDLNRGWYRRSFPVKTEWKGKRIFIAFDAVRATCEVFVNGQFAGRSDDGHLPFRFDITDRVRFAGANDLLVKVTNWRGWLAKDARDLSLPVGQLITGAAALLAPIGPPMRNGNYAGIWQDVRLEALPATWIESVKVNAYVGEKSLGVQVWTTGTDALAAVHEVLDGEKVVLKIKGDTVPGKETKVSWPGARVWDLHDPYLYRLRTRLVDHAGQVKDEVITRFGFREVQIRGRDIFLNGRRITLLADQWMQLGDPAGLIGLRYEDA